MGTSSNIWVKSGGKHFARHSSYDGTPNNVFAEIGSSIAACGLDSLRQAIASAQIVLDDGDMEQTRARGFTLGASTYLQACQARGQKAFGLLDVIRDPFSQADHAHGGVIAFFSQPILHDDGFCENENSADFVLDLDRGKLQSLFYESHEDWSSGKPSVVGFELDLERIQSMDPEQVQLVLQFASLDSNLAKEQREAVMEELLGKIERCEGERRHYQGARETNTNASVSTNPADYGAGEHEKGYHLFMVHPDDGAVLRMLVELFQRSAQVLPGLSRSNAILVSMTPGPEGGISLMMDFRDGFASAPAGEAVTHFVERVGELCRSKGVNYYYKGADSSRSMGQHYMSSSVSIGIGDDLDDDDDEMSLSALLGGGRGPAVPKDANPVRTPQERSEQLAADIEAFPADKEATQRLRFEKIIARSTLNPGTLALIPASVDLDKGELQFSNTLMMEFASIENALNPGAPKARFEAIASSEQNAILNSLSPLDRYILAEEVGIDTSSSPSKTPRP